MRFARRVLRWVVRSLLVTVGMLVAARAVIFLVLATYAVQNPLEEYHLESKMVHLCWRAQHAVPLYPEWRNYPYVSNFFSPLYFLLVGGLARGLGTSLDGLFPLGRMTTIVCDFLTAGLVGLVLKRRYGSRPALFGALWTLGAGPMEGFGTMVRPDILADLLGFAGFVVATSRLRAGPALGVALFVLAIFTKQTAVIYLVAAGTALLAARRFRSAVETVAGTIVAAGVVTAVVTAAVAPRYWASLLAESQSPIDITNWKHTLSRLPSLGADLLLLPLIGLVLWLRAGRHEEERAWAALAVVLTILSVSAALKRGADVNYFLGLRLVAALAGGALFHEVRRGWRGAVVTLPLVAVALLPGVKMNLLHVQIEQATLRFSAGQTGRAILATYRQLYAMARDPARHILTDVGLIDIRQGERTLFADPWLFHMLAETGRIDTRPLEMLVAHRRYELIVTAHDLFADDYETYSQGIPIAVVVIARQYYRSVGIQAGLFFYIPRDD